MKRRASTYSLCVIAAFAACVAGISGLGSCANPLDGQPVPFIDGGSGPAFYWPIAVAVDPTGTSLYVASSNFDKEYASGWIGQVPTSLFDLPYGGVPVPVAPVLTANPNNIEEIPSATMDTFAGTMVLVSDTPCADSVAIPCMAGVPGSGSRLFVTSRNNNLISEAGLDPNTGAMMCAGPEVEGPAKATAGFGCSFDAVGVGVATIGLPYGKIWMADPFAMTVANVLLPGTATPSPTLLVTNLSPAPSQVPGVGHDADVVAIPIPTTAPAGAPTSFNPFAQISFAVDISALGANSIVADPLNGVVYVGGCFVRIPGETIVACLADSNISQYHQNPLRFFYSGSSHEAEVQTDDLGVVYAGGETQDIALSSDGTKLYVATQVPNALVVLDVPVPGGSPTVTVDATITLANVPNRLAVIPRAGMSDLVLVTAADPTVELANSSAFLVVDPTLGAIVADVEPVGKTPYGMAIQKKALLPATNLPGFRVYVALFGDCGVAAIDIPESAPELTALVSKVGSCQ